MAERVGFRTYAAVGKRSASPSQSATRFDQGKIWATILRSGLLAKDAAPERRVRAAQAGR